jgi:predicted RNase H-like HicB family nuclease
MQHQYEFTVVLERDEDGMVIATVPALPGCHTAGESEEEALALIQDAIQLHVEDRLAMGDYVAP